jgi:NAD(P)-dependent dehydrogenase (short-subunit alcohol dehydrogenase family)
VSSEQKTGLSKPVVVVTGATGNGGRAVCSTLVDAGFTVIAVGSDAARLETVTATARYVCDLTDDAATRELATLVRADLGPVDGLVHLVGGWRAGHEADDWEWLEPRLLTTLRLATLAFHDDLTASTAGRLISVGSTSAAKPTWGNANYSVLKTAGDAWMAAVASGWRKAGTAAAVTLLVDSLGAEGTTPVELAEAILPLWEQDAGLLNGTRIDLTSARD